VKRHRDAVASVIGDVSDDDLVIRRTTAADWEDLRGIRLEALADTPDAYGSTYAETVHYPARRWRAMAQDYAYFLAARGGDVVGMASGGLNDRHPGDYWLYAMYVTPSARGSGAASSLVEAVIAWAKGEGASELYLRVTVSVERARAFYRKMGFVETGERDVMDRNRSLELVTMRRSLVNE
jgi:GNAT superfamily N-acetyltransferase